MTKILPRLVFLAGLLVFCVEISAQNADTTVQQKIKEINVIAKKQKTQSSVVQVINGQQTDVLPVNGVADVLKLFNGANIKDYGGVGGLKTVSVRSLGAAHTAVEYDGVPVSNTQAGQIDISRFETGGISEIKLAVSEDGNLLKPAKLFASGATLGISSFQENFSGANNLKITMKTGSFGYFSVNADYARKISNNLIIKTNGEFMRSDGTYIFTLKNGKTVTEEKRRNSDIKTGKIELNINYNDSARKNFNLKIYGYGSERGLPGNVILYNPNAEERLKDKDFFVQTYYKYRIFSNLTTKIIAKYNYSYNLYTDRNVMYTDGKLAQKSVQNEIYFSWINLWQIIPPLSFSVAADYFFNTLTSDITNREPKRYTIISAVNLRYDFKKLASVTLGCVFSHIREKTVKSSHLQDLDRLTPHAVLEIFPLKNLTINLLFKNTYRVPTFNELYYSTLGYTGLQPEDAKEINFGICYSPKTWKFSADFYRNKVENKIVAIPTLYIWKMSNYGKVKISGADLSAFKSLNFEKLGFEFSTRYSYQKAVDVTDKKSKLYNSQIPYTPLHSGNFCVTANYKKFTVSLTSILSGKRYFLQYNSPDNEIESYAEFSASVSKNFNIKNADTSLKFSCINFTDSQYDVIKYYPMPGRQFLLQINFIL